MVGNSDEGKLPTIDGKPLKFDLIGPTVDDDIRRLIWRYGADVVKSAVKDATKSNRGRKPEKDWPELRQVIEADARDWLAGGDPMATRTNYSIAKDFAERNPGQSPISTHHRIERKLKKEPFDRRWFMLVSAEHQSREGYPYAQHLRALEALSELKPEAGGETWKNSFDQAKRSIAEYQIKLDGPPPPEMSMKEIENAARNAPLTLSKITKISQQGGLLGLLAHDAEDAGA